MELPSPCREILTFQGLDLREALDLQGSHDLEIDVQGQGSSDCFRQLSYIQDYLGHADINCQSVLIEYPYIDRDYMEDHSVFYSRNLRPYPNWCRRAHFFNVPASSLEKMLEGLLAHSEEDEMDKRAAYLARCREFSTRAYLGFTTVKPLPGCPVGRTVLRPYKAQAVGGTRSYPCTREYTTHILGISLTINGLAFQQQDLGVSACATTALWSSLQLVKSHEDVAASSPAHITAQASRYTLPFGRPMPSEGLSIEQMCLAVQAIGMSPMLMAAVGFDTTLGGIFSATMSKFAPVLVLHDGTSNPNYHAVTVAGVKLKTHIPSTIQMGTSGSQVKEIAARCEALYIHDDRHGPYLRADIVRQNQLKLKIDPTRQGIRAETWIVSHMLVPVHPKIRLSFSNLRSIAIGLCVEINSLSKGLGKAPTTSVTIAYRIEKSFKYAEELAFSSEKIDLKKLEKFHSKIALPRYLGIITLSAPWFGEIDVLVDTTSTLSNLDFVGIMGRVGNKGSDLVLRHLSHLCQCPFIP